MKRLRELATIVVDSDNSATLPSNGNDGAGSSGDASAASASVPHGDDMANLKENIDQVCIAFYLVLIKKILHKTLNNKCLVSKRDLVK